MLKVAGGQVDKLGLLYERYKLKLFGFFYNMTGEGALSEDLVQIVFERVLKYAHTYHEGGNFRTWIFHIARNVHHDQYKKTKRMSYQDDMQPYEEKLADHENAEMALSKSGDLMKLTSSMRRLTVEKQELIQLAKIDGLKYDEIAEMLGCSVSALKVRVHRAMSDLKDKYNELNHI